MFITRRLNKYKKNILRQQEKGYDYLPRNSLTSIFTFTNENEKIINWYGLPYYTENNCYVTYTTNPGYVLDTIKIDEIQFENVFTYIGND